MFAYEGSKDKKMKFAHEKPLVDAFDKLDKTIISMDNGPDRHETFVHMIP